MTKDFSPTEWITTKEAAEMTDYHIKYIRHLVREGKIEGAKRGRDWWIDKDSVEDYIEKIKRLGSAKHDPWRTGSRQRNIRG
jgi:excisionase family DNA binding protein